MAIIFALAINFFPSRSIRLKNSAYQLSQDIQSTYFITIKSGKIHRMSFWNDQTTYFIEKFELPPEKPILPKEGETDGYRKALERWEQYQKKIQSFSPQEQTALSRLQRGTFKELSKKELSFPIQIKSFFLAQKIENKDVLGRILFYPSGEVDAALLVLQDGAGRFFSLTLDALSGRVTTTNGEMTEEEWRKR